MAAYSVGMMYQSVEHDVARNPVVDSGGDVKGVIGGPGVVVVGSPRRLLNLYVRVGGLLLLANVEAPEEAIVGGNVLPWSGSLLVATTVAGALDGVNMVSESVTIRARGRWIKKRVVPPPSFVQLLVGVWHVDVGGSETWVSAVVLVVPGASWTNLSASVTLTGAWGVGELLRVKYVGLMV